MKVTQHHSGIKPCQKEHKVCVHLQSIKHEQKQENKKQEKSLQPQLKPQKSSIKKVVQKKKKQFKEIKKKKVIQAKKKPSPPRKKIQKKPLHVTPPKVMKEVKKQKKEIVSSVEPSKKQNTLLKETIDKTVHKKVIPNQPKSESKTVQEKYLENNLAEIQQLIKENLYYPRRARKKGIEGEVALSFVLMENGEVSSVEIIKCDYDILGRAAKRTIEELSGDFPQPKEELTITLPIVYSLHK